MVLIESGGCTTGKVKGNLYTEWKEGANNESSIYRIFSLAYLEEFF